jgi:threonine aldolase
MVFFTFGKFGDEEKNHDDFIEYLKKNDIIVTPPGDFYDKNSGENKKRYRFATHNDITEDDVKKVIKVIEAYGSSSFSAAK